MAIQERESRMVSSKPEIVPGISFIPDFDKVDLPGGGSKGVMSDRAIISANWNGACGYFRKNAHELLIDAYVDWSQEEYELTLPRIAKLLGKKSHRSIIASRRALGAGELKDENSGIWVFNKKELVYVMIGAFAYSFHQLGQKKQQISEPAPAGSI